MSTIPVVIMGLGEIGQAVARAALTRPDLEIVGAVDLHPDRVGKPLGDVLRAAAPEIDVTNDAAAALELAHGGVVLHATGSRLDKVVGEIEGALKAGVNVVSTCEELAYPWVRNARIADHLERIAHKRGVTVLGTGVNPGFVMDRLIATMGHCVGEVNRVEARRVVDASKRREALQRKTGAGLSEAEFQKGVEEGRIGHVGLLESAALAAMGVFQAVDHVDEDIVPVLAQVPMRAYWGPIKVGEACGVKQLARAFLDGREVVRLELTIALGAENPRDEIILHADPPVTMLIPGGVPGDSATAWSVVHAACLLAETSESGLITVLDLPAGR